MDALDQKIVRAMQGEFPLVEEPYRALAERIGISEAELLARLERFRCAGKIRKMGAVLRHREVGYAANALCAWIVPEDVVEAVGARMAAHPAVSHCYDRATAPQWPYNVYTMLHGHSRGECDAIAAQLAEENGLKDRVMLYSVREWKKASMRYFEEDAP